jgi:2-keto-3-deoxy-L-rhamnonate aldolase RhmA
LHIDRHAVAARKGHANKDLSPDHKPALRPALDRAILVKRARTARTPEGRVSAIPNSVGENQTKRKLRAGELVLFMGVNQMRTPNIAMIAAACGFDGVYIDLEHNPTSLETAAAICVAALGLGITPIARVSSRDPHDATRILDCAAQGVMVPHVSTIAEAKAVVESCRYPPLGHRSASGSGPALGYAARSQGDINTYLNEQTLLIAMLETPEAIENADAIAAVDGIDIIHIGSSDLSTEMGIPGQYKHSRMRGAYEVTAKAARSHGKSFGVGGVREDLELQTWLMELGMRYLTGGSDVGYILSAGRADVNRIREVRLS